jgi:hypothetical protein
VTLRLLIDECLSASLAASAKEHGFHADYAPHLGMGGWQDWNLARFAIENRYAIVTNNRRDFLKEYIRYPAHAGLIVIVPQADRFGQMRLFDAVLTELDRTSPADRLLEVLSDGSVQIRARNSGEHDIRHIVRPDWISP